jgi:hypothetical protein
MALRLTHRMQALHIFPYEIKQLQEYDLVCVFRVSTEVFFYLDEIDIATKFHPNFVEISKFQFII